MKKLFLYTTLMLLSAAAFAQTYCLKATKVSQTSTTLTVIFTLSSPNPTPFIADATFLISGGGGISGLVYAGGTFSGNLAIGGGQSYQVANSSLNPSGTYSFQVINKSTPAIFIISYEGVYTLQKLLLDPSCPINQIALPVELTSFTAVKNNTGSLVSWQTASERNTSHFEVQRSKDGVVFSTIGTVKAAGNSILEQDYAFTDDRVLAGVNYYRLKSVDLDDQTTYSKIVSVDFSSSGSMKVYPNPVREILTIEGGGERYTSDVGVEVFDMEGKLVYQRTVQPEREIVRLTISTADFSAGVYMVRIRNGERNWSQKITKL